MLPKFHQCADGIDEQQPKRKSIASITFRSDASLDSYGVFVSRQTRQTLRTMPSFPHLRQPLAGVDTGRQGYHVGNLQRYVSVPFRLERGDVHNDPAAGVGALAHAQGQHVSRDAEVFRALTRSWSAASGATVV
jgi:hypothetical protein